MFDIGQHRDMFHISLFSHFSLRVHAAAEVRCSMMYLVEMTCSDQLNHDRRCVFLEARLNGSIEAQYGLGC